MLAARLPILLGLLLAACAPAAAGPKDDALLDAMRARARVTWNEVPRKVLAFYYGWYATPEVSGRWSHWSPHGERDLRESTNYPALGAYDSHDPEVVDQHCRWAVEAGLDGLIASWWAPGDFHDRGMPLLLDRAQEHGLSVTAYFEVVPARTVEQATGWVLDLLRRYGEHPAWLRAGGRPVLFVYGRALHQLGLDGWTSVITAVNRRLEVGAVFLGDEISPRAARVFDGVHTYNVTGSTAGMSAPELRAWARTSYGELNRIAPRRITCATVIPGYDDTELDRELPRPVTARHGGETYRVLWEEAIAADPDWILVTSFNEWHEGSEIEPSLEHGDRELKATAAFAARFRALPPRARPAGRADPAHAERLARLRERYRGRPVAVFPEGDSAGLWWLLEADVPAVGLGWDEVVDPAVLTPARYPALLYACGEEYRATVNEEDDVLRSLQRYVESGGTLVALSSGPMPFYYCRGVGAAEHWWKLGFPLRVRDFPADPGLELAVARRDALPHVPASSPLPAEDRWRPLVDGLGVEVESWIRLRGADGALDESAAGRVRRGEGSLVYAWFGLAELDLADALYFDLWMEVGRD